MSFLKNTLSFGLGSAAGNNNGSGVEKALSFGLAGALKDDKGGTKQKPKSASDTLAGIYRDAWTNWMDNYYQNDQDLIGIATGNEDNLQSEDFARSSVDNAFNTSQQTSRIDRERLGLSLSGDEQSYLDSKNQRAKTGSMVNAVNNARLHAQDRDQLLLSGSLSTGLKNAKNIAE